MKKHLLFLAFACISMSALSQTSGDYRSAATGDWNVAGSWQRHDGTTWVAAVVPPSSTDGIITIISPHTITANSTITADQLIIASGATLDKSSSNFTSADGIGVDMTINGILTVSSNLSGSGSLLINGTMNWNAGTVSCPTEISAFGIINADQGGKILGGTMTINGTMNITGNGISDGGGTLINNGTINKTVAGSGQADMNVTWSNAGTINILAGELINSTPYPSRSFTNTGTINLSSATVFTNSGHYIHDGGTMTGTGTLHLSTGFVFLNAALTVPASLTFNHTGGGTQGAAALTATNLSFSGGTISGAGALTLNGTTTWTGGTFSRNFAIAAGNIINADQGGKILGGTMTINGTMNITGNGISDGGGTLINNGTINKTVAGSGQADMNVTWSNAGTINILAGELINSTPYPSRSFTNTGTINLSSATVFTNSGHYIHDGGTMTGTGTLHLSTGFVFLNAALTVPASLTFNHTGGGTQGAATLTATNLSFSGGTISGAGALTLNGTTTWTGGTFSRNFAIAAGNIINADQGGKILGGTMTINGTMNITGNGISDGGGTLINNGTINKTVAGSGQADMNVTWSNAGTINILAGELINSTPYPSRSFTNTGTINLSSATVFTNSGHYIHDGGTMTGTGTLHLSTGFVFLNAALTVPASLTFNHTGGGTQGAAALTATNLSFSGGTISGAGALTLNGTTIWTGGTFSRNFAIAAGNIINADQGGKILGGTMTINGTMNITGNGISDGGGTLINNGTINKTVVATSTADIGTPVTNNASGLFKGTGILNFSNTFVNNGTIGPGNSPGLLEVNGTQPFSANSTLAIELLNTNGVGTGHDQMERNSNLTLGGTLTVTELTNLPLSSFTIINLTSGTISGSFVTVNLPAGYTMTVGTTTVILNKISTTLPLTLLSFKAKKLNNTISLDWNTENEVNTSHFEIERSADGRTFSKIGDVISANRTGRNLYQFLDALPFSTTNYYRLKQVDNNNKYIYSRTLKVDLRKTITVSISPNPASNILLIEGGGNYKEIHIINMMGAVLKKIKGAANLRLDVSNLAAGQYFVRLTGNAEEETISFLKQ